MVSTLRSSLATGMLTLVVAAISWPACALGAAGSGAKLTISPAPKTPDASPETQISILGVDPGRIESVHAVGATSGSHQGRILSYSENRGASFVPDEPFAQGESVSVAVRIKGMAPDRFTFTVAHLGASQPPLNLTTRQQSKLHHYVSRPDLVPPRVSVSQNTPAVSNDGDLLLTPLPSPIVHPESNNSITIHPVGPGGPMILDGRGHVVWFRQLEPPDVAANLRVQRYRGRPVLTWWQGTVTPSAYGVGEGVIANHSYRTIQTVHAGNGYPMDIHEFQLAGRDALFTVYSPILVHLPGTAAGTLSPLLDAIVQEVDIRTGLVVWEWHSYGHIPLSDSYATPQNSANFDAFHLNSIQALGGGRLLISARDTAAIYDVDRASGRVVWTLGGKDSSFHLGEGARFWLQHDARMLPGGRVTMFDDQAGPPMQAPSSRGLILKLPEHGRTATVDREYRRPVDTSAQSEGSLQVLPGGRVFLGFGAQPNFSEFSPGGQLLFDASLPVDDGSYRVYRVPWSATPTTLPKVAAVRSDPADVSVYASWNGATRVRRWQVLGGQDAASLQPVASARKGGFETRIDVQGDADTFAVRALGPGGRVLATSAAVPAT
ncbi:MAG: hypothetical protein QOJ01_1013 [Solirubrobacterales bacterium]|nr:hypothetical protein [Solirubrobacterales bacterium]